MVTPDGLTLCTFGALNAAELAAFRALQVSARQAFQGKSFAESLDDWHRAAPGETLGLGFLHAGAPVGLVLFARRPAAPGSASVHGLKIALPWQGRGWGHAGFRLALAHLRRVWPEVRTLELAVDADNAAARAVYLGAGMTDDGLARQGRHGPEYHMRLAL